MEQTFGRYSVIRELGRGAMGVVYLASDPMLNRQVAIKTVELDAADEGGREFLRTRLLRDARAAAVLKHPNIVAVHDIFEEGARAYVVMEYVEGESLAAAMKGNPLPDGDFVLRVVGQTAAALDYTHSRGVIHRDIKPANIMIDTAGTAKITDFGIARLADTRTSTPTGMVIGTAEYMSPEQIRGEELDGRSDQFSLAVVAYEMLTGCPLYGPQTLATLTYKIVNENPVSPCTRNPALPRSVDTILARGLAKARGERFANCAEFAASLAQAFRETPPTQMSAPPAAVRRSPAVLAGLLGVVALAGGLAVWKPWNRAAESKPSQTSAAVEPPPPGPAPAPVRVNPPDAAPAASKETTAAVAKTVLPPKKVVQTTAPPKVQPEPVEEEVAPPPDPPETKGNRKGPLTPFDAALKDGQEKMRRADYNAAEQAFQKALQIRPNAPLGYYNLAMAQQNLHKDAEAVQNYSQTLHSMPKFAMAYAERGVCLVRLHRDPEALVDFQRALEIKPAMPVALNGRGGVYFRRKQYKLALADYDAAIAGNPTQPQVYENRARAREAVGDMAGAAADKRKTAELRRN